MIEVLAILFNAYAFEVLAILFIVYVVFRIAELVMAMLGF